MNYKLLSMNEIFERYYNELSQLERDVITTTDLATAELKQFESLANYKEYVETYYNDDDLHDQKGEIK